MTQIEEIERFVKPFYSKKDFMHDLSHVKRILKAAFFLSRKYRVDNEILIYGAYFHGILHEKKREIVVFLKSKGFSEEKINRILQAAQSSRIRLKVFEKPKPRTIEDKILHDAHLIEGGETFLIVKSLVTGTLRGQTLEETIDYIENNIIGKFKCYLPEAQKIYERKEKFAKDFLKNLKENL